ncbi:heme peroxidase [Tanacetum coccineum]
MQKMNIMTSFYLFVFLIFSTSTASLDSVLSTIILQYIECALKLFRPSSAWWRMQWHKNAAWVLLCYVSIFMIVSLTEKDAMPNANSARGFEVIEKIKLQVDIICGRPIVSCADVGPNL